MMRPLDLSARLLLILLGSLILLGTAGVTLFYARERPPLTTSRFPRLEQAAGLIDLAAAEPPDRWPLVVRAGTGADLAVTITYSEPVMADLRFAPRLTDRLTQLVRSGTPVRAYVSQLYVPRTDGTGVEGYMARAVTTMPDGRKLVIDTTATGDKDAPRLFGRPASQWMGVAATLVVLLALWATARETRPLRLLARDIRRFDGSGVTVKPVGGAADLRRTADAVADMQGRVTHLLSERSLMIGTISHDLRTLLTRLRLRVAAIADATQRDRMEADLEAMDAMLSDALAFARGTATGARREEVDLADIVASELAEREERTGSCRIEADLADAAVVGDRLALRRVVGNLFDNAVKHGGGRILVSTRADEQLVSLMIEDDGPGIPLEHRAQVLQPYHRGVATGRDGLAGSGLGLAIVQQIVEAHRGCVQIDTSALGGSRFTVTFRRALT